MTDVIQHDLIKAHVPQLLHQFHNIVAHQCAVRIQPVAFLIVIVVAVGILQRHGYLIPEPSAEQIILQTADLGDKINSV